MPTSCSENGNNSHTTLRLMEVTPPFATSLYIETQHTPSLRTFSNFAEKIIRWKFHGHVQFLTANTMQYTAFHSHSQTLAFYINTF